MLIQSLSSSNLLVSSLVQSVNCQVTAKKSRFVVRHTRLLPFAKQHAALSSPHSHNTKAPRFDSFPLPNSFLFLLPLLFSSVPSPTTSNLISPPRSNLTSHHHHHHHHHRHQLPSLHSSSSLLSNYLRITFRIKVLKLINFNPTRIASPINLLQTNFSSQNFRTNQPSSISLILSQPSNRTTFNLSLTAANNHHYPSRPPHNHQRKLVLSLVHLPLFLPSYHPHAAVKMTL